MSRNLKDNFYIGGYKIGIIKKTMVKILIIEDNDDLRYLMERMLRKSDYTLYVVENGQSAERILSEIIVDYVFCDTQLPADYGPKRMKEVKERYPHQHYILIGMSATFFMEETRQIVQCNQKEVREWLEVGAKEVINQNYLFSLQNLEVLIEKYHCKHSQ